MFGHGGGLRLFPHGSGYFLNRICFLHESAFLPHETSDSESKVSQGSSGHGSNYMQRDSCHDRK